MKQNVEKAMERFNAAGKDAPQGWPPPAEGQTIHVPDLPAPPGLCWQQNPEGLMEYCTFPAGHAGRHQWERAAEGQRTEPERFTPVMYVDDRSGAITAQMEPDANGLWMRYSDRSSPSQGETLLRKMLWLAHGCPVTALYGDDGEMQCGRCRIDFKRWPAEDIERRLREEGEARLAKELNGRTLQEALADRIAQGEPVRQLIGKWRKQAKTEAAYGLKHSQSGRDGAKREYYGSVNAALALRECAEELEAALAQPPGRPVPELTRMVNAAFEQPAPETTQDIITALKNVGVDTACGACMEVAFTGVTTSAHTCHRPAPSEIAAHGWRDISTAPKDGTTIRVFSSALVDPDFNPNGSVEAYWNDPEDAWTGAVWCSTHDVWKSQVVFPTHWMPLPLAPEPEQETK